MELNSLYSLLTVEWYKWMWTALEALHSAKIITTVCRIKPWTTTNIAAVSRQISQTYWTQRDNACHRNWTRHQCQLSCQRQSHPHTPLAMPTAKATCNPAPRMETVPTSEMVRTTAALSSQLPLMEPTQDLPPQLNRNSCTKPVLMLPTIQRIRCSALYSTQCHATVFHANQIQTALNSRVMDQISAAPLSNLNNGVTTTLTYNVSAQHQMD